MEMQEVPERELTRSMSKIGKMLVETGRLTEQQLKRAIDMKESLGGKLGPVLVKLGFITESELVEFIAKVQGLEIINLDEIFIPENLIKKVSRDVIIRHEVIPIAFKGNVLTLVMHDPTDLEAIEEVQFLMNCKVDIALSTRTGIRKVIEQIVGKEEKERIGEEMLKGHVEEDEDEEASALAKSDVTMRQMRRALIPLLIEKGIITEEELIRKARELG